MRTRVFTSIAICAVALGLAGCRVQSTLIMPNGATLPYAAPGEILEWRPSIGQTGTIYVVFNGVSPCAEQFYPIGPEPARCKVLKDHNGYFSYRFEKNKPDPKHLFARSCPYCQIYIGSGNNGSAGPSVAQSKGNGGSKGGTNYPPLQIGCESGVAVVENPIQNGVQDQDQIYWVPSYPGKSVTVTVPDNMCTGGTNGVFAANQVCTVSGLPSTSGQPPISYTYKVNVDNCQGSGTITINPPPSPPAPAQ
jgi:hypothetical protein